MSYNSAGGEAPNPFGAMSYDDIMRMYAPATAAIESAGSGGYAAQGPRTKSGDRAYGRYQVMGANVPAWTREAYGRELSPQEFLRDPAAQDAVYAKYFGDAAKRYGPQGAAHWWFTGKAPGSGNPSDALGTSASEYEQKFMNALQRGSPMEPPRAPQGDFGASPLGDPQSALDNFHLSLAASFLPPRIAPYVNAALQIRQGGSARNAFGL